LDHCRACSEAYNFRLHDYFNTYRIPSVGNNFRVPNFSNLSSLQCHALTVGSWCVQRSQHTQIKIFYSTQRGTMIYYIWSPSSERWIFFNFGFIKSITHLKDRPGFVILALRRPPQEFLGRDTHTSSLPVYIHDFTSGFQASNVLVHFLECLPTGIEQQLQEIYRNI
jgi:hypothetical protein